MYKFEKFSINLNTFIEQLQQKIDANKNKINRLLNIENKTYENFVKPFELLTIDINQFFNKLSHINSVKNSKKTNEIYEQSLPLISQYSTWISQNVDIYRALKDILYKYNSSLNNQQKRVLELEIRDYQLSGCELEQSKKQRLEQIQLKLSQLSNQFSQNLLKATNDFTLICEDKDIINMPPSIKKLYKYDTKYKFSLQAPSYIAFMEYANNRQLRKKMYKAYTTRALENEDLIQEILYLKEEKAKILGFDNYAQLSLATKMANSENEVLDFLYEILKYAKPKAIKELIEVKKIAKEDGIKRFQAYDLAYYSKILQKQKYDIDDEFYKQYFEQNGVIKGIFTFIQKLFCISFKEVFEDTWDEKVKVFHLIENDKIIAKLYLDLESRDDKMGGAWMNDWHTRYRFKDDYQLPTAFIVANFTPSKQNTPSLLTHDEVVTLFHELGHALHHLLSKVDEPFISGINGVEWDGVEFPSQFLEYFAYEKDVLKMFAKHYKDGHTLDDESIDKLKKAKNFQSAIATIRQLEFAIFDFKLYQKARNKNEVQQLLDEVRKEVAVIIPPKYNKFQTGFSHIFAGGYSAGYYSYKWAEVLSADAFMQFSTVFDSKKAKKYKQVVLAQGGSKSMDKIFKEFASHKPDIKSLLKIDGII